MKTTFRYVPFTLLLLGGQAFAQIPNAGFENWDDHIDFLDPSGWMTLNEVMFMLDEDPSVERISPGHSGAHAARVTSVEVPGLGLYPGMLISGDADTGMDGFPYAQRPASLVGMWQVDVPTGDMASVNVMLSRWDPLAQERVVIAYGSVEVQGSVPQWTAFSVPIEYFEPEFPDSATIAIFSGEFEGVAGSTLWIDDLAFEASTGIHDAAEVRVQVYPVPTRDDLVVETEGMLRYLTLHAMDGRLVREQAAAADRVVVDLRGLPSGAYLLVAHMADGRTWRRQVVKD